MIDKTTKVHAEEIEDTEDSYPFAKWDRPQQYARKDPWPLLPFDHDLLPDGRIAGIIASVVALCFALGATFEMWKWW